MTNQHPSAAGRLALLVLLCLGLAIGSATAQDLTQRPVTTNVNYAIGGYYECLPLDYKANPNKKYPLMIFIHGIGERGDGSPAELPRVLRHGPPQLIDNGTFPNSFTVNGQTLSFIVISPQFRDNYRDPAVVSSLIDYCVAKYHVDENRIYLTGLSMGGGISWVYAGSSTAASKRIAAMLVIAGNTNSSQGAVSNIVSASLPIWITHNDGDPVVPSIYSKNWAHDLNGHNPPISPKTLLNIFNADVHDAWTKTYNPAFKPNGLNVYEWMLLYKRTVAESSGNQPPTADAGSDQTITLPTDSITLAGKGSDADGSVAQYAWKKVAGPDAGTIASPAKATTAVRSLVQGTYTFQLTVTDNDGATGVDEVKVVVSQPANQPPVANAGNDITIALPLDSVAVQGDASDADGSIASTVWTKVSGPSGDSMENKNALHVSINGLTQGTYVYRLTATDDKGATDSDDVKIVVNAEKPAVAKAGSDTLIYKNQTQPDTAVLNGAASVGGSNYVWEKLSGPGQTVIDDSSALNTYAIGLEEGTHVFQLTIDGKWRDTVRVVVRDWQKKNVSPCRPGGGKSFVVPESYPGQYNHLYINRDNVLGEPVMGGDTLYFKGGKYTAFEIGDFGGGEGCPVYVMPKDQALVITDGYFRIGIRDSNVVQHVVLDGTVLRSKGIPYGFFIDNRNVPAAQNNYAGLTAHWVSDLTIKGYHSINTGILQIKLDAQQALYGRYDKFVQKHIKLQDNFIDGSSAEGMYIGSTASNGGQLNNPYGPPPRMDSVEITDNIITNTDWDGIQLANARTAAVVRHNFIYKTGLLNQPSQRAGLILGGNTTGIIDSNVVINSKGNGIQVFGYGSVKVHSNVVDSINGGGGDQDGLYETYISVLPETFNIPLSVNNFGNLISRVERKDIRIANNTGNMIAGHTYYNTFIDSTEKNANNLISAGAGDALDHNRVIGSFPFQVNGLGTKGGTPVISMTQGDDAETFTTVKDVVDWLFGRLNGVSSSNQPPIANAGTDKKIKLPVDSVTLNGSGADVDGTIVAYQWKQISGPNGAVLQDSSQANAKISNLQAGVYKFELTVTDNGKANGRDTVKITVDSAAVDQNNPPNVFAGNNLRIKLPVNNVTLNGTATDDDGTISAIQWTKISGPDSFRIANDTALQTRVDSLVTGVYQFRLTATDNQQATSSDTIKITVVADTAVTPANVPPIALAGADQTIQLPVDSTTLTGAGADADGTVDKYRWQKVSGPKMFVIKNPNSATSRIDNLEAGVYQFELMVTDNMGATKTDTVQVTVLPGANQPPLANAGADITIQLPDDAAILNGKGADGDGSIDSYEWTQLSGPAIPNFYGAAASQVELKNLSAGTYSFQFKVTDNDGASAMDTMHLLVKPAPVAANKPPVAYAGYDMTVQLPDNTAVLSGSGLDEDGSITKYQWRQLSGPATATLLTSDEAQATANNLVQGIYQFELQVTDDAGATSVDTIQVTVKAPVVIPNKAPVVSAGNDITLTLPTNSVTLAGRATDPDGTIASVQWSKISGSAQYTIATPQAAQTEITNLGKGIYTFELKATDDKGAVTRDTVQVTVMTAATRPMFVMNAGDDQVLYLPTDSVSLQGVVDDPYQTVTGYSWKQISGPAQGTFSNASASHTMVSGLVEGVYLFACTVRDENANTLSDTVQVTVKVLEKSTASLYPNPSNGAVYIRIKANTRATNTMVMVYDLNGRVVYREQFMRTGGEMVKSLDLSKLKPGLYTIQVGTDINHTTTMKLVKQ